MIGVFGKRGNGKGTATILQIYQSMEKFFIPRLHDSVVVSSTERSQLNNKNFIALAMALYDFSARDIRELSLQKGDLVQVTIRPQSNRGWWKGRLHNKVS